MKINTEIEEYYNQKGELNRLGRHSLERLRTQEIISRYLPDSPCRILDVGGATGAYAFWLSGMGHQVHLIDPVPYHIDEATRISALAPNPLASIAAGEARHLEFQDDAFDIVLMLGPLYHLPEYGDRLAALEEARRVTRPGGLLVCAVISRWAALTDGFFKELIDDPKFVEIMYSDARTGKHTNPAGNPGYFTTAYFHRPAELEEEIRASGWLFQKNIQVESFGGLIPEVEYKLNRAAYQKILLDSIRLIEEEETLMGVGAHLIGIGRKKEKDREI